MPVREGYIPSSQLRLWKGCKPAQAAHHTQAFRQLDGPSQLGQEAFQHGCAGRFHLSKQPLHNLQAAIRTWIVLRQVVMT